MKAISFSETWVDFNGLYGIISQKTELFITTAVRVSDPTQRYIPEGSTLHIHRCENLKSYFFFFCFIVMFVRQGNISLGLINYVALSEEVWRFSCIFVITNNINSIGRIFKKHLPPFSSVSAIFRFLSETSNLVQAYVIEKQDFISFWYGMKLGLLLCWRLRGWRFYLATIGGIHFTELWPSKDRRDTLYWAFA